MNRHNLLTPLLFPCLFIVASTANSFGQGLSTKLIGNWIVDAAETEKLSDESAQAIKQYRSLNLTMQIEFQNEEKLNMRISVGDNAFNKKGTWKIVKEGKKIMTIEMTMEGQSSARKALVEFQSDGQIKLGSDKKDRARNPALILKRVSQ